MQVRAGSSLLVPRSDQHNRDVSEFVADNARLSLQPEIIVRRGTVIVRRGDTLGSLAARHGVSASNLASWNKLQVSSKLRAGQRLSLVQTQRASAVVATSAKKTIKNDTQAKGKGVKRSTQKPAIKPARAASKSKGKTAR